MPKNVDNVRVAYADLKVLPGGLWTKAGVRGYPGLDPLQVLLRETLLAEHIAFENALDLTAYGGALAVALAQENPTGQVAALEMSAAAFRVLGVNVQGVQNIRLLETVPWSVEGAFDLIALVLPAHRGNALVRAMLFASFRLLKKDALLFIAGEKDRGFERYFKEAKHLIGSGEILVRTKGARVACLRRELAPQAVEMPQFEEHFSVMTRGRRFICATLPGVFAQTKLDRASELLLEVIPSAGGKRVLDLGSGCGILGAAMASEGATVTLLDDDLLSVEASKHTLELNNLQGDVLHSDVDSALEGKMLFDLIVTNPPFHLGHGIELDLPLEFIGAIDRHLCSGGEAYLVANDFLSYETQLVSLGHLTEHVRSGGFKVLSVRR